MADAFDDLVRLESVGERTWMLVVDHSTANPAGALYGGAPLAASIMLAEEVTGAPVRWATTRFLRPAADGDRITIDLRVEVQGRRTSHLTVTGSADTGTIFETVLVVGAGKPGSPTEQWIERPDVPAPDTLPTREVPAFLQGSAVGSIERRLAEGVLPHELGGQVVPSGRIAVWMRIPGVESGARPTLAWLADCVPLSILAAMGQMPGGSSLDNTIRFATAAVVPTDWVLVDIRAGAVDGGYGYGEVHLWSEDGTLLATGSQTAIIRLGPLTM